LTSMYELPKVSARWHHWIPCFCKLIFFTTARSVPPAAHNKGRCVTNKQTNKKTLTEFFFSDLMLSLLTISHKEFFLNFSS
jgi:hypothetical protein